MYSAIVAHNIPGIKAVLPIYEQWPEHDRSMARYAKGLLAQSEGRAAEAIGHYRRFIAEQPDASAVRWQLATALFEDKQNEAAADQFDKLQTESLPPALQERIETYRKALRERDSMAIQRRPEHHDANKTSTSPRPTPSGQPPKRRTMPRRASCLS